MTIMNREMAQQYLDACNDARALLGEAEDLFLRLRENGITFAGENQPWSTAQLLTAQSQAIEKYEAAAAELRALIPQVASQAITTDQYRQAIDMAHDALHRLQMKDMSPRAWGHVADVHDALHAVGAGQRDSQEPHPYVLARKLVRKLCEFAESADVPPKFIEDVEAAHVCLVTGDTARAHQLLMAADALIIQSGLTWQGPSYTTLTPLGWAMTAAMRAVDLLLQGRQEGAEQG